MDYSFLFQSRYLWHCLRRVLVEYDLLKTGWEGGESHDHGSASVADSMARLSSKKFELLSR